MQTPLREFEHPVNVLLPSFRGCLRDGDSGRPLNLTQFAAVAFRMIPVETDPDSNVEPTPKVDDAAAVFDDKSAGLVRYDWTAPDVDTKGRYHCWFVLTDSSDREELFPVGEKLVIEFV